MISSSGSLGARKHRQAIKRTTPVSGPAKAAVLRASNRPVRRRESLHHTSVISLTGEERMTRKLRAWVLSRRHPTQSGGR